MSRYQYRDGGFENKEAKAREHALAQLLELFPDLSRAEAEGVLKEARSDVDSAIRNLRKTRGQTQYKDNQDLANDTTGFCLYERVGDLFSVPDSVSLGHCVSVDLAMGKGIATIFKEKFGGVDELKLQKPVVGTTLFLRRGTRHIFYLITKPRYFDKPSYKSLRDSLAKLKQHCISFSISTVALPRIGCGLDGLVWPEVKRLLVEVFGDMKINIEIYRLQ